MRTSLILAAAPILLSAGSLASQQQPPANDPVRAAMREANQLDGQGRTKEARAIFQRLIDSAATPAARAQAQRAMAMSHAFDGDCLSTLKYELLVMDYWRTREAAEPQNAFYQQGEMANEAARVCIDAGHLEIAEVLYRLGSELGNHEPSPRTHPKSLWDYRLSHALGRLAARRGNREEALRHVADARKALDSDTAMAAQQERFFPYLVGYVHLFTNDLKAAEAELVKAVAMRGNDRDPFMHALLAMTYEKQNRSADAKGMWQKAYDLSANAHNPPAAYTRPVARKKIGS